MSQLNDSKKRYDEIPIPEELSARVQEAIEQSEKKRAQGSRAESQKRFEKRDDGSRGCGGCVYHCVKYQHGVCQERKRDSGDRGDCKGLNLPLLRTGGR